MIKIYLNKFNFHIAVNTFLNSGDDENVCQGSKRGSINREKMTGRKVGLGWKWACASY